ncbi:unnamed protein product, partial [Closterium sp. NIES-64]
ALEAAQQCTELREEWNKGWFRKGEALFALQRYDEAEEAYRQALERAPDDATVKQCLLLALEAQQGFLLRQMFAGREFCVGRGRNVIESQVRPPSLPRCALPPCPGAPSLPAQVRPPSLPRCALPPCPGAPSLPAQVHPPSLPRHTCPLSSINVPCHPLSPSPIGPSPPHACVQIYRSAQQMRNFIYLVGDAHSREAVVVDGAWDVEGILRFAEAERVKLVGAVVTHYHFDHTGGMPPPPFDALGIKVPGIRELAAAHGLKVYANKHDAALLRSKNGVPSDSIVEVQDGATIEVGAVSLRFIHTPGHTPGSQCIHIERAPGHDDGVLISGDTLFIGSCGRLDLPDCNREAMYDSLQKLAALPPDTRVYPGHDYGGAFTSIGKEKATGFLRPMTKHQWLASQTK